MRPAASPDAVSVMPAWTRGRTASLLSDLLPPAVLAVPAFHELLYDHGGWSHWALVIATLLPLLWRRRHPELVLTLCLFAGLVLRLVGVFNVGELSVLVALYSVAAHRDFTRAIIAAVVVEAGVVVAAFRFAPGGSVNDAIALFTFVTAATLFAGIALSAQRRYLAALEDRTRRLEIERAQQAELAAAAERARIAREMHDVVAHGLAVVITLAQGAAVTASKDPERSAQAMAQVAAAGRQALAEMRRLLNVLRSDSPAARMPQPQAAQLQQMIDDITPTGLVIDLAVDGAFDDLSPVAQTTVYRIVQESLTNVLKHAPNAGHVVVDLALTPPDVCFSISNDGGPRVANPPRENSAGTGLHGMRERVAAFGGSLTAGPTGEGWLVRGNLVVD